MRSEAFDGRMQSLVEAFEGGEYRICLDEARRLKRDLLAADPVDPLQLGWARFYEFKSLYELKEHRAAYDLINSTERVPFALSSKNAAWMFSVGAELAMHLGKPEEIVRFLGLCLDNREKRDDLAGCFMAASTACTLLGMLHREDLNAPFARKLVGYGRKHGVADALHEGYRRLLENVEKSRAGDLIREVAEGVAELRSLFGKETDQLQLYKTLHRIESADWYRGAVGVEGCRALDLARRLREAAEAGDAAAVEACLGEGADVNARGADRPGLPTALIAASFNGRKDVVALLLGKGADLEIPNGQGRTALIAAADQGYAEVVRLLLRGGARPDPRDFQGRTALHVAGWQGHGEAVKALLEGGADPGIRDALGNTPLAIAASADVPGVVEILLDRGADLEAANDQGQTPLMNAAMEGRARIVKLLLKRGADAKVRDRNGMTALDWAKQEGHREVERLLAAP